MKRRTLLSIAGALASSLVLAPAALASFPGDNGVIAFAKGGDIWTVRSDGTGAHRLTSGPAVDGAPEWAPDGRWMLFTRDGAIWRMNADGTGAAKVIDQGDDAQISADGKSFIYLSPQGFNQSVRGANIDGSGDHVVHEDSFVVGSVDDWAPTHSLFGVTFIDDDDQFGLFSPTGVQVLGFGLHDDRHLDNIVPAFSPDGSKLAFTRRYSNLSECAFEECPTDPDIGLATMDIGGGGLRTIHQGSAVSPAWSPDGNRIVFVASGAPFTPGPLQMVREDGSGKKTLAQGASAPDWQPLERRAPEPEVRTVTVPGPTVTVPVKVKVPGPVRVVQKVVARVVPGAAARCVIPRAKRRKLTLTIRATKRIRKGAAVRVTVDLAKHRATVARGKGYRVRLR
jgi:dipeptidyl aminopeptidase/acylaminoacyl peptidase